MFHVKHMANMHLNDIAGAMTFPEIQNVSRETFHKTESDYTNNQKEFGELISLWLWWNRKINLFSRKTTAGDLELHIKHSLLIRSFLGGGINDKIIDAGTGGGLPGIPLAITDTRRQYLLVDKVQKKQLALRDIIKKLNLGAVTALHSDIGKLHVSGPVRIVTKHAFSIPFLLGSVNHLDWSQMIFLKGDDLFSEISEDLNEKYHFSINKIAHSSPFFYKKYIVSIKKL